RARETVPGTRRDARARRPTGRPAAVRAPRAATAGRGRARHAHRDHEGRGPPLALRARRLAVRQPPVPRTVSTIFSPGAEAVCGATDCATTLPREAPFVETSSLSFASLACARESESPTTFGITPCSDLGRTIVILSPADAVPLAGNWSTTRSIRSPVRAGL